MSIAFGMILLGALLIYGGWKNLSIVALSRGDNSTPKSIGPNVNRPGDISITGGGNFPQTPTARATGTGAGPGVGLGKGDRG